MKAWIALGSNLNNPKQQILEACQEIADLDQIKFLAGSKIYQSSPIGPQDQEDFFNGCILVETTFEPIELLDQLQAIEQSHHRTRERHWGPRTLDLDIIKCDEKIIDTLRLKVPHPLAKERLFVLLPMQDIEQSLNSTPPTKIFKQSLSHWINLINNQEINSIDQYLIIK